MAPQSRGDRAQAQASKDSGGGGASVKGFVGGTASGLTKLLVGHPFDTIKVRMQCSPYGTYRGPLDCFLQLARKESLLGLYKGASPPAMGWAITDAVLLGSLHNYRLFFSRLTGAGPDAPLGVAYHGLAGLMAGWTNSLVTTPVELLKAKLQMQHQRVSLLHRSGSNAAAEAVKREFTGPFDCGKKVINAGGVRGLWHALPATLLFRSSFGVMFASYDIFQRQFASLRGTRFELSPGLSTFLSGGLAAEFFWLTAFPADIVKNRMMADSLTNAQFPTIRKAFMSVYNQGDPKTAWARIRNFYTGFLPCFLRAFPTNAAALFAFETTMRLMGAENTSNH